MNAVLTFDERMRQQRERLEDVAERQRAAFADEYARIEAAMHQDVEDEDCTDMG